MGLVLLPAAVASGNGTSTWRRHAGVSCYAGHGAVDLEKPPGSSLGAMTTSACQAAVRGRHK